VKVWIEGQIVEDSEAKIPVLDHGLLYGDGVFEGIRILAGRVLDLDRHLARLEGSARAIELDLGAPRAHFAQMVLDTARANARADAYVRLIVTRGTGLLGVDPASCTGARAICIVGTLSLYPAKGTSGETTAPGVSLATVALRRPDSDVLDPRVKSLNYLNNVMAKLAARRSGADEALMLNRRGLVAETSGANVFIVRDGILSTPPVTDGALEGITRRRVLVLAAELGIDAREQSLSRYDLLTADEVFLTGSGAGIVPVHSLDNQPLSRGPLAQKLLEQTRRYALEHGTRIPGLADAA
jgi:branched-chain amino acid aminotransferase